MGKGKKSTVGRKLYFGGDRREKIRRRKIRKDITPIGDN